MNSGPYSQANPSATKGRRNHLDSWKEIASFLGRSEKTVRRWEETEGLPVHRLHHEKRASVYAYTAELEQWRETRKTAVEHEPAPADAGVERQNQAPSAQLEPVKNATNRPAKRGLVWLVAGVIVVISGVGVLAGIHWGRLRNLPAAKPSLVRIQSLAVLPFKNISGDTPICGNVLFERTIRDFSGRPARSATGT
ncbi:MAG TPA: hypothetical protein VHZ55_21910 [Bryobacteraceae bacterium]|nr:hypothetical protein [Bryobacteraceae bacterium]